MVHWAGKCIFCDPPRSRDPPHEGSNGATFRCGGANRSIEDLLRTTVRSCYPDRDFLGDTAVGFSHKILFY